MTWERQVKAWQERRARVRARSNLGQVARMLESGEEPLATGEFQILDRERRVRLVLTDRRLFVQRWSDDHRRIGVTHEWSRLCDVNALVHVRADMHVLVTRSEGFSVNDGADLPFVTTILAPDVGGGARTLLRVLKRHLPAGVVHPQAVRPSAFVNVGGFLETVFAPGTSLREELDRALEVHRAWDLKFGDAAKRSVEERLAQESSDRARRAQLAVIRRARMSDIYRRRGIDPPPGFALTEPES